MVSYALPPECLCSVTITKSSESSAQYGATDTRHGPPAHPPPYFLHRVVVTGREWRERDPSAPKSLLLSVPELRKATVSSLPALWPTNFGLFWPYREEPCPVTHHQPGAFFILNLHPSFQVLWLWLQGQACLQDRKLPCRALSLPHSHELEDVMSELHILDNSVESKESVALPKDDSDFGSCTKGPMHDGYGHLDRPLRTTF